MKKAIQLVSIAACLVFSMAACQSNENKAPQNTATETTPTVVTPTTAPATAPQTVTATPTTVSTTTPPPPTTKATVEPAKVTPTPAAKDMTSKGATVETPSASPAKTAVVKWEETVHNWGSIKQGEKMTHVFKFKNTGSEPLIILSAEGSCGCTVPEKPTAPIAQGKTGEIKVVFDSNGKEGPQVKTVKITANTEPNIFVLTIKGDVKKD